MQKVQIHRDNDRWCIRHPNGSERYVTKFALKNVLPQVDLTIPEKLRSFARSAWLEGEIVLTDLWSQDESQEVELIFDGQGFNLESGKLISADITFFGEDGRVLAKGVKSHGQEEETTNHPSEQIRSGRSKTRSKATKKEEKEIVEVKNQ